MIEDLRGAVAALASGRCDVISQDGAGLATTRTMLRNPDDYAVLPDRISKEPIAPVFVSATISARADQLGVPRPGAGRGDGDHAGECRLIRVDHRSVIGRFLGLEVRVTDGFGLDRDGPRA